MLGDVAEGGLVIDVVLENFFLPLRGGGDAISNSYSLEYIIQIVGVG